MVKNSTFEKKSPVFANTAIFDAEYVPSAKSVPYCTFERHMDDELLPNIDDAGSCVDDELDAKYDPPRIPIVPYTSVPTHAFADENARHALSVFDDAFAVNVNPDDIMFPYHSFDDHPGPGAVIIHASVPIVFELAVSEYTPGAVKLPKTDPFDVQKVSTL